MSGESAADSGPNTPEGIYERLFGGSGSEVAARGGGARSQATSRRVLAVIWATVDRDRVLADLEVAAIWLADDSHLGASVGLVRRAESDPIAILEPLTEGRLAASLARHGEGPAGEYVEAPIGLEAVGAAAATAGLVVSRPADGPFGRSVIVLSGTVGGPHLVLVERAAGTIGR